MINLIPPTARKGVVREYWIRVISVWMLLLGTACLLVATFLLPTYVLIRSQINALSETASASSEKVASFDTSAKELLMANTLATILVKGSETVPFSQYLTLLKTKAGNDIELRTFEFMRSSTGVGTVTISGQATTRQALASFRDTMETEAAFSSVDLPISNLIKERDVLFSMKLTIATSTPTI